MTISRINTQHRRRHEFTEDDLNIILMVLTEKHREMSTYCGQEVIETVVRKTRRQMDKIHYANHEGDGHGRRLSA